MSRLIKISYKGLMIFEAGYVYCKRHNLNYDTFIDDVFLKETFNCSVNSEFDNICKDLRHFRRGQHKLVELTEEEYEDCVEVFGEQE